MIKLVKNPMRNRISNYLFKDRIHLHINFYFIDYLQEKFKFEKLRILLIWIIIYFSFILLSTFSNSLFESNYIIPVSFLIFINSSWGGFLMVSLLFAIVFDHFFFGEPFFFSAVKFYPSSIVIPKSNFSLSVFSCHTPILHSREDFNFFLKNFMPMSIELSCEESCVYIILFGSNDNIFELRKKECFNVLNSMYSNVRFLLDSDLKNFICKGSHIYLFSNNFKEYSNFIEFKKWNRISSKSPSITPKMINNIEDQSNLLRDSSNIQEFNVFLLMLYGSKSDNQSNHFFRGVRIGNNSTTIGLAEREKITKISQLKNLLLSNMRIPEKSAKNNSLDELELFYFFIIHKYFDYYFGNFENKQKLDGTSEKIDKITPNILSTIENKIAVDKNLKKVEEGQIGPQPNLNHLGLYEEQDLKKIIFQFTYFCQFFCPLMINEFKKKTIEYKKAFSIPNSCQNHILLANINLKNFNKLVEEKKTIESIFSDSTLKEDFFEFISEL